MMQQMHGTYIGSKVFSVNKLGNDLCVPQILY
jgi:hypothetical protein